MIAVSVGQTNIFLFRKVNTWFSVKDGNWSDPNTWVSNALDKKFYTSPQPGDNVWINNNVICDINATVGNLYGNGYLSLAASILLTVNGDIQITGTVDQSSLGNGIILNGYNNVIVNYASGSRGLFAYNGQFTQAILPLPYYDLQITGGIGVSRIMSANITVNNFYAGANLVTNNFSITVNGNISNLNSPFLSGASGIINSAGTILFIGNVNIGGGGHSLTIIGAASVECRGGITAVGLSATNSNFTFTTNNQTISDVFNATVNSISISGAITVTNGIGGILTVSTTLNGTVAGSTFVNNGSMTFNTLNTQMATGVFTFTNSGSTVNYVVNASGTLPYNTYANLGISGTGIKSAGGNLTVNNLITSSQLELSTYNLTVNGTTAQNGGSGYISKSGGGSLLFVGAVSQNTGSGGFSLPGNPTIEFRGGFTISPSNTGTGVISFTTNNQSIQIPTGSSSATISNNITIAPGITVTRISDGLTMNLTGVLNGASSTAIFINNGIINYQSATAPMVIGKLYCNQIANTWIYGLAGNQDITVPSDATPGYYNLTLNGSGAKRLLGNVSVKAVYTLTPPATLNSNGFSLINP